MAANLRTDATDGCDQSHQSFDLVDQNYCFAQCGTNYYQKTFMRNENRRNMLALIIIDMVATLMFIETFG